MIIILVWSVVLLAALWLYLRQVYSRFSKYGVKYLPPVPLLGNHAKITLGMEDLGTLMLKFHNSFREERFIGTFAFLNPVVFIRDLELLKKIAVKDFEHFLNHKPFIDENVEPLMGKALFSLNDQKWKDMRSTLSPAFTSSKIRLMVPFMVEVGNQMVKSLNKKIGKSAGGYIDIDVKDLMCRYTNDVIASCAFGLKVDSHSAENNQFYEMGKFATNFTRRQALIFAAYKAFPNLMKTLNVHVFTGQTQRFFKDLVLNTIKEREAKKIIRNDMIHLLIEAKNGNLKHELSKDMDAGYATVEESDVGKKQVSAVWSDDELVAQAVLFFIGGFETVSTAMSFCLHELAMNPDIQDRLVREIQESHEKNDGEINYNTIQRMTYMDMVVSAGNMILFLVWSVVLVAALWLYFGQVYSRFSKHGVKHLPPVPLLGNMGRITCKMEHFADFVERVYNSYSEEKFVGNYDFLNPVVFIRDLELLKKITVKDFEHFLNHRAVVDENVEPLFGRNLFALKDQKWKDMRSTLSPAFTSSKIRLMVPFMVEVGDQMVNAVKRKIEESGRDYIDIDSKDLLCRYTNDVIASCAFGLKVDSHTDENNQFYFMGKTASNFTFKQLLILVAYTAFPKIMKTLRISMFAEPTIRFFRDLVMNTMNDRKVRNINRNDMIHLLMEAKKGNLIHDEKVTNDSDAGFATVEESDVGKKQVNRVWTDDDLIAQAVLFFIAGFESVSTAMVFGLYELAVNPDIQDKLVQEIRENHEKNNGQINYNSIQQMTYMDMVVSEVLRLWSPAVFTDRMCTKDYNLGKPNKDGTEDYIIHKGEGIGIPIWAIHRSAEYFPDPLRFDPERFSEQNKHNIKPYTYMPFGLGPRNCIGSRFALCEIKVMLYQLLLSMEVSPAEKTRIPLELAMESFNLRIKGGHWIRMKMRN